MKRIACGVAAAALVALAGCQQTSTSTTASSTTTTESAAPAQPAATAAPAAASTPTTPGGPVTTASGIKIEELVSGSGLVAQKGKMVSVHYTGWLTDQTKFDSSLDRGQPFDFVLGTGAVIRGWDEGLEGMKVGGKRRLTIPPDLAYGTRGFPPVIPPNATLVFDCELMDVR